MFTKTRAGTLTEIGKLHFLLQVISKTDGEYVEAMHTSSQVQLFESFHFSSQ